jgi:hypothetical protein
MGTSALLIGLVAAVVFAASVKFRRKALLERLRSTWAQPIVRPRNLKLIAEGHAARTAHTPGARSIDDRTWADLNLDDIFVALDRTTSTLGQHALYHRIRTTSAGELAAFEALIERFTNDVQARERAQIALDRLRDPQGYDVWWLGRPDALEARWWYAAFPLLTVVAVMSLVALWWWPALAVVMLGINLTTRQLTDKHFGAIATSIRQCAPLIATAASLRFLTGNDVVATTKILRNDVPRLARLKWISNWANGNPLMLPIDSARALVFVGDFVSVLYEYFNLFLLLDATGGYFGLRDLNANRAALLRVTVAVGEVDAAISMASYREGTTAWTRPAFLTRGSLNATDLRHPLVAEPVPNSIDMKPGSGMLVTGSNMSGKSTFLRTVGVNVVLAQTLNTCLAREYAGPVFEVRSCIGRSDDLIAGKSYYLVEVEALLGLVRSSEGNRPHLFLLDELFRGTNAVERVAAGHAVLHELLEGADGPTTHLVIAATHDAELIALLPGIYEPFHFGDSIGPGGLVFDHHLKAGPATTRTAIALLRQSGAPERLLERATLTAARLDDARRT